jgi:LPS export ABC transporter protein LptC
MKSGIFILLVFCLIHFQCKDEKNVLTDEEAGQWLNKEMLKNINLIYSDSGKIEIRIIAPQMIRFTDKKELKEEFPIGFQAFFYGENNELLNTLSSKYAIRVRREGKTYMRDSVTFTTVNKEILKTSELVWDEIGGRISTDKFVRIIRKDELLQGYGFETDQNFLRGTVKAVDAIMPAEKLYKEDEEK